MADYEAILKGKYPAKAHARKVVEYMRSKNKDVSGVLYLEGQKTKMIEDNDGEAPFRQRRFFYYLTGCSLPDSYLTYDIQSDKSTLYIPPIDADSVIWSGLPMSAEEALSLYDIDSVLTTPEITSLSSSSIYAIADQVSTSVSPVDTKLLKEAIEECRVFKDEYEVPRRQPYITWITQNL
ncbi:putative Xaa-pro aminopeptidase pepP [Glarea lozoyensis 74030]|uniref:Putative Xaa-pro aminopeptidase pepP n=1 Tax=Glarea lozoyensis (strain ATCC 74030 / MF5533) TaxID=1104152 RepID=H0ELQ9_GLAL7|nr:putative Xaa-pro aminopeptidase pepP [Glarea lozoyensis 74030]